MLLSRHCMCTWCSTSSFVRPTSSKFVTEPAVGNMISAAATQLLRICQAEGNLHMAKGITMCPYVPYVHAYQYFCINIITYLSHVINQVSFRRNANLLQSCTIWCVRCTENIAAPCTQFPTNAELPSLCS